eukprot:COSAG02_NODE_5232_length_4519_cov_4.409050_2_plen_51_part_00
MGHWKGFRIKHNYALRYNIPKQLVSNQPKEHKLMPDYSNHHNSLRCVSWS